MNNFDTPRIQILLKPLPQPYAGDEKITKNVPERQAKSRESVQRNNVDEANIGQLSPPEKEADVFAANPKAVAACRGSPMRLDLKDLNSAPYVAPIRHYTPEKRKLILAEIEKNIKLVLWAIDKFASHLQARPCTLITDCSTLTWLFKGRALSAKYRRRALRLMQYDMDLRWRSGSRHQFADALSRSHSTKSDERLSTTPSQVTT